MKTVKWAPHIPLIGGHPLGAEMATGIPPSAIYSLPGFHANDRHYVNYQNVTLGRNLDYNIIEPDDMTFIEKLDIVVSTPPCAALSSLNSGKSEESRGAGCAKNDFMYICALHAIHSFDAEVLIVENAPSLYTNKGQLVADKLVNIAKDNGRSITFYKTSTIYHGIPQNRDRTFMLMWKSPTAPVMEWFDKPRDSFSEFLGRLPAESVQNDEAINTRHQDDVYLRFMKHKMPDSNLRKEAVEANTVTALQFIKNNGWLEEAFLWAEKIDEKGAANIKHAINKFSAGQNVWDNSTNFAKDYIPALIGRNMQSLLHPVDDRSLTLREAMYCMGMPNDFELLDGRKNFNMIAQNVPATTAADMTRQAIKFINGQLPDSGLQVMKQNNHKKVIDTPIQSTGFLLMTPLLYSTRGLLGKLNHNLIQQMGMIQRPVDFLTSTTSASYIDDIQRISGLPLSPVRYFIEDYDRIALSRPYMYDSWEDIYDSMDVSMMSKYTDIFIYGGILSENSGLKRGYKRCDKWPARPDSGQIAFLSVGNPLYHMLGILKASTLYGSKIHEIIHDPHECSLNLIHEKFRPKNYQLYFGHSIPEYGAVRLDLMQHVFDNESLLSARDTSTKDIDFTFGCSAITKDRKGSIARGKSIADSFKTSVLLYKDKENSIDTMVPRERYLDLLARSKYTLCIPPYDKNTFSIYRMQEALHLDCLPLIRAECRIDQIISDFDLSESLVKSLVVDSHFVPCTEADRCDKINRLKQKLLTKEKGFIYG